MSIEGLIRMELHTKQFLNDGTEIVRVPNGWLYRYYHQDCNGVIIGIVQSYVKERD